jgi:hypothetical protein
VRYRVVGVDDMSRSVKLLLPGRTKTVGHGVRRSHRVDVGGTHE